METIGWRPFSGHSRDVWSGSSKGSARGPQGVFPEPLLRCLGFVLRVIVLLEVLWPSLRSRVLNQVFKTDISVLCSVQLSLNPDPSPCHYHWTTPSQLDAAANMLWPFGWYWTGSSAWSPPDITLTNEARQLNLGFIKPVKFLSHSLRVLCLLLANCSDDWHSGAAEFLLWPYPDLCIDTIFPQSSAGSCSDLHCQL